MELAMAQTAPVRNPFMLMISPEVVFAAIENSERLSGLNRHLCRPLDRLAMTVSRTSMILRSSNVCVISPMAPSPR